jgi:hypothetical protein
MTAKEAISAADALRKNNPIYNVEKQRWLRQMDQKLRHSCIEHSVTNDYDNRGADLADWNDGLEDDAVLLLPEPYDAAYVHGLCAQIDLALGETDRYANEAQQYNANVQEFAARMRQKYRPAKKTGFRY